jgi:hypothetical protein
MGFNVDAAYKVDTVAPKSKKNRIWNQYQLTSILCKQRLLPRVRFLV